ncbi:RNA dependent RNA polymerase-domain-containing protein [Mycena belliarum]|uniref:RNA-dependent RNA polymerase n=1 Tax=Mycena belliarum TaxID=1033014 RepID=A0AAD6XI14_9AGAR|nr:RNA dependent RNA polymerase-domain-containing protein [Mycena belliae]
MSSNIDLPSSPAQDSDEERLWSSLDAAADSSQTSLTTSPGSSPTSVTSLVPETRPLKRKHDSEHGGPSGPATKMLKGSDLINVYTAASRLDDGVPFVIAGFKSLKDQTVWDNIADLPSGVSWELARLVSMGRATNLFLDDLSQLKGSNAEAAPRTVETILNEKARDIVVDAAFAAERKSHDPWNELDLEERALAANPNAALGNCPEYDKGYGGKICFSGSIEIDREVKVVLERCTLTSSCRLYRQFGSSQFLRLKVPSKKVHLLKSGLIDFFRRPFVIWGNVFRSFYAKEGTVFLFKTREMYRDGSIQLPDSARGLSLFEFLDQFNPLKLNSNQKLCKWASRFALGLSNSVPGPVIAPEDVDQMDDIISPANSNMTDGCGLSNLAFNLKLRRDFNLDSTPCAVQVRHGGRKGMLLLWPDTSEVPTTPKVAFRKSQIKINYSKDAQAHPANATIDILRFSHTKSPARISPEVIINLEHNGVPAEVFVAMQDAYIAQSVDDLLYWAKEPGRDKAEHMLNLWAAVEKSEGVYMARRVREAEGEARFRGFGDQYGNTPQDDDDEDELDSFDLAVHERSTPWWPDYISGCPSSLAETVMALIDPGFTPQSLPVLRDKLKQIVRKKIKSKATHFKYDVRQSASAFVVPDPWGVLEEDQIHFKSSRREFHIDEVDTDTVLGNVLMTRNPCKLPTDVRKVKAVRHLKLADTVDVIVCSVRGQRRLLDFLAGGDYDGDTAIVIWDKTMVDPFINAPERFSVEPQGLDACFVRDEKTVAKFIGENRRNSDDMKAVELQLYLLGALRDPSVVGHYSSFQDNAIVKFGYAHPLTVELGHKFGKILDSPKTGYVIRPDARRADAELYTHSLGPAWKIRVKNGTKEHTYANWSNSTPLQRKVDKKNPMLSRRFIMDVLDDEAQAQQDRWLADAEQLFLPFEKDEHTVVDPDLTQPWRTFTDFAAKSARDGDAKVSHDQAIIIQHVEEMYAKHKKEIKARSSKKGAQSDPSNPFTGRAIEVRQDVLRALSRDFAASPTPDKLETIYDPAQISRLRASYAYICDSKHNARGNGWSRFPWDVALGELCKIKATAAKSHKPVSMPFYERFKVAGNRRT